MQPTRTRKSLRTGPKLAHECIASVTLLEHARSLSLLDQRLRRLLPVTLAHECRLADIRNGRMVFLVTSSTWATRLRMHQTLLLSEARVATCSAVEQFVIKVALLPPAFPEPTARNPLSTGAAAHLQIAAQSMADPELRALFLQLASLAGNEK